LRNFCQLTTGIILTVTSYYLQQPYFSSSNTNSTTLIAREYLHRYFARDADSLQDVSTSYALTDRPNDRTRSTELTGAHWHTWAHSGGLSTHWASAWSRANWVIKPWYHTSNPCFLWVWHIMLTLVGASRRLLGTPFCLRGVGCPRRLQRAYGGN
jgi:hypothetical protein